MTTTQGAKQRTRVKGGRVDGRGIDGRTLSAISLRRIHSGCQATMATRSARAAERGSIVLNVEKLGACRTTCLDIVGLDKKKPMGEARRKGKEATVDLAVPRKCNVCM
jgi:hypothetical protein